MSRGRNDNSPRAMYRKQKCAAGRRGIGWEISFADWLGVWARSGHFHERGKSAGEYCMARIGDVGPYATGNVEIVTNSRNSKDRLQLSANPPRLGTGRGWKWIRSRYQVEVGEMYVGRFKTQAEAVAAYRREVDAILCVGVDQ